MPLLLGLKREGLLLSSPSVSLSVYPSFYLSLDFLSLFKFPLLFPNHFVSSFLLLSLYLSLLILSLSLSLPPTGAGEDKQVTKGYDVIGCDVNNSSVGRVAFNAKGTTLTSL